VSKNGTDCRETPWNAANDEKQYRCIMHSFCGWNDVKKMHTVPTTHRTKYGDNSRKSNNNSTKLPIKGPSCQMMYPTWTRPKQDCYLLRQINSFLKTDCCIRSTTNRGTILCWAFFHSPLRSRERCEKQKKLIIKVTANIGRSLMVTLFITFGTCPLLFKPAGLRGGVRGYARRPLGIFRRGAGPQVSPSSGCTEGFVMGFRNQLCDVVSAGWFEVLISLWVFKVSHGTSQDCLLVEQLEILIGCCSYNGHGRCWGCSLIPDLVYPFMFVNFMVLLIGVGELV